ncbi:DNA internalization-related competence protein ComEC/Rec2 [candidate division KSB1 bacterium]|nr:DNA internalization-related competence protein ComEC/Rec2 [candidate division KSB1 bacterium]
MRKLKYAPALKLLFPYVLGLLTGSYLPAGVNLLYLLIIFLPTGVFFLFYKPVRKYLPLYLLVSVFFVLGVLFIQSKSRPAKTDIAIYNDLSESIAVEGVIKSPPVRRQNRQTMTIDVDTVWVDYEPFAVTGRVLCSVYDTLGQFSYGDRIAARGFLRSPAGERNPGEFNYRRYLASKGIFAMLNIQSQNNIVILNSGEGQGLLQTTVYPVRDFITRLIDTRMKGQQAALLKGLLVGAREDIDDELRQKFANVGIVHILAISGLHVGFILFGLMYICKSLGLPRGLQALFTIAGLVFYAALTGGNAPVVRASVMAGIYLLGVAIQRRNSVFNTLSIAALVILLVNPLELFQPGFQLSFTAVLGIVLIYQKLHAICGNIFSSWYEKGHDFRIFILQLFLVSLSAQIATLPLTAYYFGRISVVSVFINLLVVPAAGLIVGLGFVAVIFAVLYMPLGGIFLNTVSLLLSGLIDLVQFAEKVPFSYFVVPRLSVMFIVLYFTVIIIFLVWRERKARKSALLFLLMILNVIVWSSFLGHKPGLKVTFFDVGQGDSILFEFPDKKILLVDAGERNEYSDRGRQVIAPYLQRNNIKKIDVLLISHPHSDHIGGAPYLLGHVKVGRIVRSKVNTHSPLETAVDSLAMLYHIKQQFVESGDTLSGFANTAILILHPDDEYINKKRNESDFLNNTSVVFKLIYGRRSFLLPGDAEQGAEEEMMCYNRLLKADVLKLGHHGSSTANSAAFRERVYPDYAVVSVGRFNRFGLPDTSLLKDMRGQGIDVIRTDDNGAVVFFTDGRVVERWR